MSPDRLRLKVSENQRFLMKEDGAPFFGLADTAWCLRKLSLGDIDFYVANRVQHRFNAVQVYCGDSLDTWMSAADPDGNRPYPGDATDRPSETFWRNTMDPIAV